MRLTSWIASATEAGIVGRDRAAPVDGSYTAGDGYSAAPTRDKESAAGLGEGIVAAIALCPVDALKRDSGLALLVCLRHIALRLKGINPSSRHPLRFLSTLNPLSQAGLKHCIKCSHFKALCPTLCVCRSLFNSVNRRVSVHVILP